MRLVAALPLRIKLWPRQRGHKTRGGEVSLLSLTQGHLPRRARGLYCIDPGGQYSSIDPGTHNTSCYAPPWPAPRCVAVQSLDKLFFLNLSRIGQTLGAANFAAHMCSERCGPSNTLYCWVMQRHAASSGVGAGGDRPLWPYRPQCGQQVDRPVTAYCIHARQ